MHYLITGGAGFIGCHLAEKLLERGTFGDRDRRSLHRLDSKYRAAESPARVSYIVESIFNRHLLAELIDDCRRGISSGGFRRRAADRRESGADDREQRQGHRSGVGVCRQEEQESADHQHLGGLRQIDQDLLSGKTILVMGGTQKGRWSYACSKAIDEFLALAYWKEKRFAGG